MTRRFALLTVCLLALGVAGAASAGTAKGAGAAKAGAKGKAAKGPIGRIERALPGLNLTTEQKPKVDQILKDAQVQFDKIKKESSTPQDRRPKLKELTTGVNEKLEKVLSADQLSKLKQATARKGKAAGAKTGKKTAKPPK